MKNNIKNKEYKAFLRSTSNINSTTNQYQINLPPLIWTKMKWKINENIRLIIDKETNTLKIRRDDG